MKPVLLLYFTLMAVSAFSQIQNYNCEAVMFTGNMAKLLTHIEINDSTVAVKDIKSDKENIYKIVSKSINGNSYKISDGVREVILDVMYHKNPPIKVKGKYYHFWITLTTNNQTITYFGELSVNKT